MAYLSSVAMNPALSSKFSSGTNQNGEEQWLCVKLSLSFFDYSPRAGCKWLLMVPLPFVWAIFLVGMSLLRKQRFFVLASTYSWTFPARGVPGHPPAGAGGQPYCSWVSSLGGAFELICREFKSPASVLTVTALWVCPNGTRRGRCSF